MLHLIPLRPRPADVHPPRRDARVVQFGMYTAGFLAVVNISIMYLALPQMESRLGASLSQQQWILSIYPLMEGGFTLASGVLGDLYGRKLVLTASTWLFVLATIGCAFAPSAGALIVARGVEGIASAALLSLPLAMLIQTLPDPSRNMRTIQLFATVAGLAAGFAPLIGGALVTYMGWKSVFYFSALLGIVVLATLRGADECCAKDRPRLDVGGQVTSTLACLAISYALIEHVAWAFAAGAALAALFVVIELRSAQPMVDLRYFALRRFDAALLVVAAVNFAWYGLMLLVTLYLQHIMHLREIVVGLYLMPCNAAFFAANLYSERICRALGMPLTIIASFAVSLGGTAWLALVHGQSPPWHASLALALAGIGWGLASSPATSMGMAAVRARDEGFASATLALCRSLFGVFGIAVLGSLLTRGMSAALPQTLRAAVHQGRIFEMPAIRRLVQDAYVHALHLSVGACFAVTVILAVWALVMLRSARSAALRGRAHTLGDPAFDGHFLRGFGADESDVH
jgi:DHA2 family methylenomycin A resistance protein-like MFS transporter